ncbi:FAD-linked oxidase-like protein [Vararia minispora EC-137]|uniref:FAD-linked oxidase-like protein n=1 Tax=Vararia minispora EC-137 TaxID=1314806 RepID=A0ACB8QCA9_9AGAM|nr:FAD-linked oxidase-like protein [Vararia minispora EC-137]
MPNSGISTKNDTSRAPTIVYATPKERDAAVVELRRIFLDRPDAVSTEPGDPDYIPPVHQHSVVVYPESTEDVVKIVKVANKYRVPVVPYAAGTSLEGHLNGSSSGSICVDMARMNKVLEIHEVDADMVCQPAVGWMEINETLRDRGIPLFFPLDPAPSASIGGMFSTGCSGTNAVRYGTARAEWFLNATIVLPSGEVIKTRRRSRKSSAGFDVTKLFIGAEGTLGIVTELTIRLAPLEQTTVATVRFPDVRHATEAVVEILNSGIPVQCVELCDEHFMRALNLHGGSQRKYSETDHLFIKLQGSTPRALAENADRAKNVVQRHEGEGWALAGNEEEAESMWADRKNGPFACVMYGGPGARVWSTDVCVPISKLPQLVDETRKDIDDSGIKSAMVGHVGDGNFHAILLFKDGAEHEIARGLVERMVKRALALDGTCTGEHGVGTGKKKFLEEELGEETVRLMKKIKRTIDPLNLFNPGKVSRPYPVWSM